MHDDPPPRPASDAAAVTAPRAGWAPGGWPRRLLTIAAGMVALVLLLWALGYWALPPLVKSQAQKIASDKLGRAVTIGAVEFVPWTLELTVRDLIVAGPGGQGEQLRVKRLYADAEAQSLFRLAPVIDRIVVEAPHVAATRTMPGRYDFDDVLARLAVGAPPDEKKESARFALHNIEVTGGSADINDRPAGARHQLRDLTLGVPFLSTFDAHREVAVEPRLAFTLDGSRFDSAAAATPFNATGHGEARLTLQGFDVRPFLGHLPGTLPVRLQGAVIGADLKLAFERAPRASLKVSGTVEATDVKVTDAREGGLLDVGRVRVTIDDLRPLEQVVKLGRIEVEAPHLQASRDAQGRFNLLLAAEAPSGRTVPVAKLPSGRTVPVAKLPLPSTAASAAGAGFGPQTAASAAASASVAASTPARSGAHKVQPAGVAPAPALSRAAPGASGGRGATLPDPAAQGATAAAGRPPASGAATRPAAGRVGASAASGASSASAPSAWKLTLAELSLRAGVIDFRDAATAPQAALALRDFSLDAKAIQWPLAAPIVFEGRAVAGALAATPAVAARAASAMAASSSAGASSPARSSPSLAPSPLPSSRSAAMGAPAPAGTGRRATAPVANAAPASASVAASVPVAAGTTATASPASRASAPSAGTPPGTLTFSGQATERSAQVSVGVASLPIALGAPYLRAFLAPALTGTLSADLAAHWQAGPAAGGAAPAVRVTVRRLRLEDLALRPTVAAAAPAPVRMRGAGRPIRTPVADTRGTVAPSTPLAAAGAVEFDDATVDLAARTLTVGRLLVRRPALAVERDADGRWMAERWLVAQPAPAAPSAAAAAADGRAPARKPPAAAPWRVAVGGLSIEDGAFDFRDRLPPVPVALTLSAVALQASALGLDTTQASPVRLSAQVTEPAAARTAVTPADAAPASSLRGMAARRAAARTAAAAAPRRTPTDTVGRIDMHGTVGPFIAGVPSRAAGKLALDDLPLAVLEPYFGGVLAIDIQRAQTSFRGDVSYVAQKDGPRVQARGDAEVEDFRATTAATTAAATTAVASAAPGLPASAAGRARTAVADAASAVPAPSAAPLASAAGAAPVAPATAGSAPLPAPAAVAAAAPRGGLRLRRDDGRSSGQSLLNWKSLSLRGVDVALVPGAPLRASVEAVALTDFFARVTVNENGRINLQDLTKASAAAAPPAPPDAVARTPARRGTAAANTATSGGEGSGSGPAPAAAPSAAVRAPRGTSVATVQLPSPAPADGPAPVIRIGPTTFVNGRVAFTDRFIRPNYSASLTELNGRLGGFDSQPTPPGGAPQLADLELRGRAEGTASLEIAGKVNPLAKPLALDIQAKVRDLEMPPLSPYAIKYAGYGIERGKLSVDVAYLIQPDGRLTASNKVVLRQLVFGDKVEGAPNSLPVKLAVALLADRDGVIDLDLPVSGSINDPQFSIAGVLFKALGNLIFKAVTAPFTLLASAFSGGGGGGSGGDLSTIDFAPGSAALTPSAREALDKVANGLAERPRLKLTVVGTSSLEAERDGWKEERLRQLLRAEKRRASVARGGDAAADVTLNDAEVPALLKEVYRRAEIDKPRNALGLAKDLPPDEMRALLLAAMTVSDEAMQQLATRRGVAVRDHLIGKDLPADRLFLGAVKTASPPPAGWTPRAELKLTMD